MQRSWGPLLESLSLLCQMFVDGRKWLSIVFEKLVELSYNSG